ncbi:MAG: hypothetical protein LBH42_10315 [Treponema sp.]|nr:hypothetical protein [Treponema sp.]
MDSKKQVKSRSLRDLLTDHFSDTWKLLSQTSMFLSRIPDSALYEEELRAWRLELQSSGKDGEVFQRIRKEIIELRKSLRWQGYDLGLVTQNLVMEGFRNDVSLGEGFRRVVIFFGEDDVHWLAGEDNHVTLAELLEKQLYASKRRYVIRSKHYLWYRRKGNNLVLSGSDTETKEDFKRLEAMVELNSLLILAKLKNLK